MVVELAKRNGYGWGCGGGEERVGRSGEWRRVYPILYSFAAAIASRRISLYHIFTCISFVIVARGLVLVFFRLLFRLACKSRRKIILRGTGERKTEKEP